MKEPKKRRKYIDDELDGALWAAIKRLTSAKRRKASPQMIERLENRVKEEAAKTNELLGPDWQERLLK